MNFKDFLVRLEEITSPDRFFVRDGAIDVEPVSSLEVARLLGLVREYGVMPVLPWEDGELRFSPRRMNAILELDRDAGTVRVQAGIRWEDLEQEMRIHGFTTGVIPPRRLTVAESVLRFMEPPGVAFTGSIARLVSVRWAVPGDLTRAPAVLQRSSGPRWDRAMLGRRGEWWPVEAVLRVEPVESMEVRTLAMTPGEYMDALVWIARYPNVSVRQQDSVLTHLFVPSGTIFEGTSLDGLGPWTRTGLELTAGSRRLFPVDAHVWWNTDFRGAFVPEGTNREFQRIIGLHEQS